MHQEVFQEPQGLPPKKDIMHSIVLKLRAKPINVKPYKYAYHHKDEIERQVNELLQIKVIKQCVSPFSSLIILVKKNYDSWKTCVDYRVLNKVIMLDEFPIPTISELLDKLHKTNYFLEMTLSLAFIKFGLRKPTLTKLPSILMKDIMSIL